jgi:hypothetical protein
MVNELLPVWEKELVEYQKRKQRDDRRHKRDV